MVTGERVDEAEQVGRLVVAWAGAQDDVAAAAVVGSWARGAARMSSDLDIVVLTETPLRYVDDDAWVPAVVGPGAEPERTMGWGRLTERRVRLTSGLVVELGFAEPSWAAVDPVDPGTAGVVGGGCCPLIDPDGLLERLIAAVGGAGGEVAP